MRDLTDPHSSRYHQWLTAQELGERFGPASADIDTVMDWLRSAGFKVNGVFKSGLTIDLSGTAGEVRNAFHTEIHRYLVNGSSHIANASAPMIPAALAPVVAGMVSLNNFMPKPQLVKHIKPDFTIKCTGCPDGFNNRRAVSGGSRRSRDDLQCRASLHGEEADHGQGSLGRRAGGRGFMTSPSARTMCRATDR